MDADRIYQEEAYLKWIGEKLQPYQGDADVAWQDVVGM